MAKLTAKQRAFCDEYLIDLNATQAAIRAGYSKKNAFKIGSELLHKTTVAEFIQKRMSARQKRTEITQDMVLEELAKIGFANINDYVEIIDNGRQKDVIVKASKDIPQEKLAALASIKEGANGIEVKVLDKVKALECIGRHLGMFKDKVELSTSNEIQIKLED